MKSSIADRSTKVLVIEPRVDLRGSMREAAKALGYVNSVVVSSIREALDMFAVDPAPPKWIISSLLSEDKENALHLLAIFLRENSLRGCRLSLVVKEEEKHCLTNAFELGLLSWHSKPFTIDSLTSEFQELISKVEADTSGGCVTACHYLRMHLTAQSNYPALVKLEESLIRLYPQNGDLFLNLAEAQHLVGDTQAASRTIFQAKYLGARVSKGAQQLLDVIRPPNSPEGQKDLTFAEAFDLKNAIVVDSDQSSASAIKVALTDLGILNVEIFGDGLSAWDWVEENGEPSVIIQEWRIPKLSGPGLLQRFRSKGIINAPIIVISSLVKGKDLNLLRELGAAQIIEKPIDRDVFITSFMATVRQEKFPNSAKTLERKLLLALAANNMDEAKTLKDRLATIPNVPIGTQKCVEAAFAFQANDLKEARRLGFEALKASGDSLLVLNLIGKIFLKLRAFEEAVKCFNKAQELSSQNLERLCLISEAQTEMGNFTEAKATVESAKTIDVDSVALKEVETKLTITSGDNKRATEIMKSLDSLGDIVAYTNNRAVSLARSGNFKGSQELYERALASLPPSEVTFRPTIIYNLALSYARINELKMAEAKLTECLAFSTSAVWQKANVLKYRVSQAIKTGQALQFKAATVSAGDEAIMAEIKNDAEIIAFDAKPGEICAHQVFNSPDPMDENVSKWLKKIPAFHRTAMGPPPTVKKVPAAG